MFKRAFTLAEVLVTLGIIGVVAALTMPSLVTDTEKSKIGPKLAKAVAVFEQANTMLLQEHGVDNILDIGYDDKNDYAKDLSQYMKATVYKDDVVELGLLTKDNLLFEIANPAFMGTSAGNGTVEKFNPIYIHLNPSETSNGNFKIGFNRFQFHFYTDGSLVPYGATSEVTENDTDSWKNECPANKTPSDIEYCTGHIFENNLKVLYKL